MVAEEFEAENDTPSASVCSATGVEVRFDWFKCQE